MMQTSTPLTKDQLAKWTKLVLKAYPKEAVAYIVNGHVKEVKNVHPEPEKHFSVSVMDRFNAEKGKITGFLHSHTGTPKELATEFPPNWPSTADMKGWLADNTRWGISVTEGENVTEPIWLDEDYIAPLVGRPFIGGIWDCYTAVRDWFRVEKGIILKNYPRGADKWQECREMYDDYFEDAGFVEIDPRDVKPGDCALYMMRTAKPVHAAVIIDDLTIFHQLNSPNLDRVSGYDERGRWEQHVAKFVRYVGEKT